MLPPFLLTLVATLLVLAVASIRRIPEGQVYALRRLGGHTRLLGAGTHFTLPLIERVAHKISLGGSQITVESADAARRATIYFQVIDPARMGSAIGESGSRVRAQARRLLDENPGPTSRVALKQALQDTFGARGLRIVRVDLEARD
ncbi:hypothetical protein [Dokdonella sp.]|uniref:hypothetical protein n=1 Tax=Dokdonella sp. TaxID=2291710 RepID=UPI0031C3A9F5|nr:hypothetical protein [Dokdonella sp.]